MEFVIGIILVLTFFSLVRRYKAESLWTSPPLKAGAPRWSTSAGVPGLAAS